MGSFVMTQTTEAACLLQSGAMYPRRVGFKTATGGDLFAGVKPGGVSLYFGDAPIYHFDLDGRWQRAFIDGVHYLKGLDATVRSIDRERENGGMVLRRNTLPFGRAVDLDASIRAIALDLIDDLDSGRLEILESPSSAKAFGSENFRDFLERVAAWDSAAWFAHRERYLGTYGPIPFLPPDCPNALVLQATLGHANGRAFGRAKPAEFYVRSSKEFAEHAAAVSKLIGRRIGQFNGIFLAGTDVFRQPSAELLGYFEVIRRHFPIGSIATPSGEGWDEVLVRLGTIQVFLDDFRSPLPDLETWRSLKVLGLGRVTLGVESGSESIRSTFGKSWQDNDLREVVSDLKAAGIGIGVVVLVGSGGREPVDSTVSLLDSLTLGSSDLVTLVDARSLDQAPLESLEQLSTEEVAAQMTLLKSRLSSGRPSKGAKVVVYNPDKQSI
jgi:hypothetical protein